MRDRLRIPGWILITLLVIVVAGPYVLPLPGSAGVHSAELAPAGARFVAVDGARLHIQIDGPLDGPPVALIHGLGGSAFSWRLTGPELAAAGFRTLALDLRGFGLSDKSFDANHTHAAQAQLVAATLELLGMSDVALVGHSMGASVAVHVALTRPDLVDRLVLVNAWLRTEPYPLWPGDLLHVPPVARWGQHAIRALATPERVTEVLRTVYSDPDDIAQARAAGHLLPVGARDWDRALLAVVRDLGRSELPAPLESVDVPTLIVWGADDPWLDATRGEQLRDAIPGAEMALIADAGHLPFEEQPDSFMAAMRAFLPDGS